MKKIMFNDKYGLTNAVLNGEKTMTRRLVGNRMTDDDIKAYLKGYTELVSQASYFKIGEVVAVAQAYKDLDYSLKGFATNPDRTCGIRREFAQKQAGWSNKMFVSAKFMSHRIRITGIKVEQLQDISDEDCFKEGIIPITWRQHLQQDLNDLSPQKYIEHNVYTLEKFREGIENCWAESDPNEYMAEEAKVAFAVLIFKMLGRKVWERNPYVFVYTFVLVD